MNKRALIVDVARCTGCHNCVLATKDEHVGNDFPGYSAPQPAHGHEWISIKRIVRGSGSMVDVSYVPKMCNHCDNAPCIEAAGDGAIRKRDDGVVIIDPVKARGRKDLVAACPYGAISWNEEAQLPQSWFFDAHLLDAGWAEPRCVQVCPTGALQAVHDTDAAFRERVAREGLEVLRPELGTRPRVFYQNLQRATHCFVGGNVCRTTPQGRTENVVGARVSLSVSGGKELLRALTDHFGDFKIDGLPGNGASYTLEVVHPDFGRARLSGLLDTSNNHATILLSPSQTQEEKPHVPAL
ncbi:MAG TPA: 4Fe-4S dicluster domain-containing protein [Albitalea sp.]|uniref:4Fe-4S dicluster domain-containing protein n=1 Tax=Piscinibacter sp. TaxID=1903157 RepID=UPI002ED5D7A7